MHKKSVPLIRQMGTTDCGIAALTMIFQYYKYKIDISELKATTSIGRNGMSLAKMKEITEEHNFSFKAYGNYETEENLIKCLPIIMCSKENHYVVVAEKKYGKYILLDPLKGKEKVDYSYIKKNFLDVLVCVRPTEKNYKREKRESFLIPINKSKLFLASILTLVTQGIILIPPLIIKKIVNEITYDTLGFNFVKYALLILSVALSYLLANLAKKRVILILQNNIYKDTIFLMLNKIFDIDLSYFESHSSGDIENRFNSVSDIYEFISTALISTVIDVVTAVFCGIMMITQSIPLFAVIIIMTVIQITIVMILNQKARIKVKNYIADQSALQARMVETLTIEMDKEDGISAARRIRTYDKNVRIIYVTSHESYMRESFEVRPFQFLVKPVTDKIMEKCFKSVYEDINSEDFYFRYSYQRMNHKVPIKDILYFESNKRKIFIVTEQEILELYGKLNEIEETLKTCKISFLRVHQSFLVNYKHISGQSYDSVVMDNGQKISISEDRRKIISEQYCSMEDTFYVDE